MAGFTNAFPLSFAAELPQGIHDFTMSTGDLFKVALGVAAPTGTYDEGTTNYSNLVGNADEVPNGSGYITGGFAFSAGDNITPAVFGSRAAWQWSANPSWVAASFSVSGCLIYNVSKGNRVVFVGSFGGVVTLTAQNLNLIMPTLAELTALLRIRTPA